MDERNHTEPQNTNKPKKKIRSLSRKALIRLVITWIAAILSVVVLVLYYKNIYNT